MCLEDCCHKYIIMHQIKCKSLITMYLCKDASATAKRVLQSLGDKCSNLLPHEEPACERSSAPLTLATQRFGLLCLCEAQTPVDQSHVITDVLTSCCQHSEHSALCHFIPFLIGCFHPASEAEGGAKQKHLYLIQLN